MTRLALALWMLWAVVVWNVIFDQVIVLAGRDYIQAALAAGAGPFGQGGFGFNDLFDAFFSGDVFAGRTSAGGPLRGPDAETVMQLTLQEVVTGARRTVEMRMPVECDTCGGSGGMPGTHPSKCPTCDGVGEVRQVRRSLLGQIMTAGQCPACAGLGTTAERLACSDPDIAGLAKRMDEAKRRAAAVAPADPRVTDDTWWRRARDEAGDPILLARLYERRIRELDAVAAQARDEPIF